MKDGAYRLSKRKQESWRRRRERKSTIWSYLFDVPDRAVMDGCLDYGFVPPEIIGGKHYDAICVC